MMTHWQDDILSDNEQGKIGLLGLCCWKAEFGNSSGWSELGGLVEAIPANSAQGNVSLGPDLNLKISILFFLETSA